MFRRSLFVLLGLLAVLVLGFTLLWNLTSTNGTAPAPDNTALAAAPEAQSKAPESATLEVAHEEQPVDRHVVEKASEKPTAKKTDANLTPAEAELARGQWVEGHVKLPDGTPADEKIVIEARGRKFSNDSLHSAPVDANGNFRVAFSKETKTGWLRLKARYAYLSAEVPVKFPLKADANKTFELEPALGGCLRGKLVLPPSALSQGSSLAGTHVQIWRMSFSSGDDNNNRSLASEIAADQSFEIGGVPDKGGWSLNFDPDGFTRVQKNDLKVQAGKITDFELALKLGARLSGRLVDEDGKPVAGATFSYQSLGGDGNNWSNFHGKKSGDDGLVDLRGTPSGKGTLTIEKEGFLGEERKFEALAEGDARAGLELVLHRGNSVAGVVQWQDGKPAADAQISIHFETPRGEGNMSWNDGHDQTLKTDAEGKFRFTGLGKTNATLRAEAKAPSAPAEDGSKAVEAAAKESAEPAASEDDAGKSKELADALQSGNNEAAKSEAKSSSSKDGAKSKSAGKLDKRRKWTAHMEDIVPGTQNVALMLTSGFTIQGRVVDAGGAPVKEFLVRAEPVEKDRNDWEPARGSLSRRFADEGGRFALEGLHEGDWKISAEAKNMPASSAQQIKVPGQTAALELTLMPAASVSGIVVDPSGAPAKLAKVRAEVTRDRASPYVIGGDKKYSDTTDAAGKFEIQGIPAGPVKLIASADAWAASAALELDVRPGQKLEDQRLSLRRPGRISGLVLDHAGHPDAGRPISSNSHDGGNNWQQAVSDANGRFTFEKLAPGEYQVYTQVKSEEQAAVEGDQEKLNHLWQEQQRQASVKVEEGATAEVTLGGAPKNALHLVGRVTCAGKPVASCYLNAWKQNRGDGEQQQFHTSAQADGSYDLVLDGEGTYNVNLTPSGSETNQSFEVKVGADARQTRDFELASSRVAGRVVDRAGKPQPQVWLSLQGDPRARGEGRNTNGSATTDEEGRFAFEHVGPGVYVISCGGEDMGWRSGGNRTGRSTLDNLKVETGKSLEGLELVLQPACRVEGVVIGVDGAPVAGARVWAVDEQGKLLTGWSECKTDAAGHFEFEALPPVRAAFTAKKGKQSSPLSSFVQVRENETTKVDLALANGTTIFVQAVDAEGKQVGADLQVLDSHGVEQQWLMYWGGGGKSDIPAQPGQRIGPLAPGKYTVIVMRKDKPDVRQEISVSGEESKAISVRCD